MPYTTERGATSYRDHNTPREYATGEDEDRSAYNAAQDAAFNAVETLLGLIDGMAEPLGNVMTGRTVMTNMAVQLTAMVEEAKRVSGGVR